VFNAFDKFREFGIMSFRISSYAQYQVTLNQQKKSANVSNWVAVRHKSVAPSKASPRAALLAGISMTNLPSTLPDAGNALS
jgi:hypothetical protein